jgi:hypothetical protein
MEAQMRREYECRLSGFRSAGGVSLRSMSCFEVELRCGYGIARKELQQAVAELVDEGRLCTYELFPSGRENVQRALAAIFIFKNHSIIFASQKPEGG